MDYQKAYYHLFNAISDAIESIEHSNYGQARDALVRAQQMTEEAYLQSNPDDAGRRA